MVISQPAPLDLIFGALADPTRRGMLELLARGAMNVRSLAEPFKISQPAISKHLRVLEGAGLIRREKRGREHHISVNTRSVAPAQDWIAYYTTYWEAQFDAVDQYLKTHHTTSNNHQENPSNGQ